MKEALVTVVSLFPPPPSIRFLPFPFRTEIPRCKKGRGKDDHGKAKSDKRNRPPSSFPSPRPKNGFGYMSTKPTDRPIRF